MLQNICIKMLLNVQNENQLIRISNRLIGNVLKRKGIVRSGLC